MKIVADDKIPFLQGVLEPYADMVYLPGAAITPADVRDADALIVRTRTKCGAALLTGSNVKLIATATIGFDHIDPAFCAQNGIRWVNAPGCNADSVVQYLLSLLVRDALRNHTVFAGKTLGVVGVGNVGKRIAGLGAKLGMNVLLNDPPRARIEGPENFRPLEQLCREADFITFHVPLTREGADRTFHLADEAFFLSCARKPFFINASRGETASGDALASALIAKRIRGAALDVWENEPDIDVDLLPLLDYATPHIAGYSADGKANGTAAAVRAVAEQFHIDALKCFYPTCVPSPATPVIPLEHPETALADAVLASYDILRDDGALRAAPDAFESLRGNYPLRREFPAYTLKPGKTIPPATVKLLSSLGFHISPPPC